MLQRLRVPAGSARTALPDSAAGFVPGLSANLVEGVGGPPDHVEGIGAADRVEALLGDHSADPVRAVRGDVGDQLAPVLAEGVEEELQGGLVPARGSPHESSRVVVDHDGEVAVAALVGDLIDSDPGQSGEPVVQRLDVVPDPGDDRPDGAPGDPHQLGHRALRTLGRQPGDLLVEHGGVTSGVPGPRHRPHRRPVLTAVHPRRVSLQLDLDRAQVQGPPPPPPRSYQGDLRRHRPHRLAARRVGRTRATSTCSSSSNSMSSTTVFSTPSRARHKVTFCTPFSAHWFLFFDSSET